MRACRVGLSLENTLPLFLPLVGISGHIPCGLLGFPSMHLPTYLLPFVFTQELRTPFLGRYSDLMDGITTSWSTDGAAKVGEGTVQGPGCYSPVETQGWQVS